MVDYLTTVAVSVTAGVEAIIALAAALNAHRVALSAGIILLLMLVNLRGVREAGAAFILPTYLFIGSLGALLRVGLARLLWLGGLPSATPFNAVPVTATEPLSAFLVLRAFAGGERWQWKR